MWLDPDDVKPVVPYGKYAISVLVIMDDVMYGENCQCDGRYVTTAHFIKKTGEFEQMQCCKDKGYIFEPVCDPVLQWMYLPSLPEK